MEATKKYLGERGLEWIFAEEALPELLQKAKELTNELTAQEIIRDTKQRKRILDNFFLEFGYLKIVDKEKFCTYVGMPDEKWVQPIELIESIYMEYRETDDYFYYTYNFTQDDEWLENFLKKSNKKYALQRVFKKEPGDFDRERTHLTDQVTKWLVDVEGQYNFAKMIGTEIIPYVLEDVKDVEWAFTTKRMEC